MLLRWNVTCSLNPKALQRVIFVSALQVAVIVSLKNSCYSDGILNISEHLALRTKPTWEDNKGVMRLSSSHFPPRIFSITFSAR